MNVIDFVIYGINLSNYILKISTGLYVFEDSTILTPLA
jgi:hypothetical protein